MDTEEIAALQKLFDKSLQHIRKQGKPSYSTEERLCRYNQDGLGCGAAPFILKYEKSMEGKRWIDLVPHEDYKVLLDPLAVEYSGFVSQLQNAHDGAAVNYLSGEVTFGTPTYLELFMDKYETEMKDLAQRYGLEYTKA